MFLIVFLKNKIFKTGNMECYFAKKETVFNRFLKF